MENSERKAFGVLSILLFLGAILRWWIIKTDFGIYWPDEIYQSIEPAHHLAFGYGLLPWEFVQGARNIAFTNILSSILLLCETFHLSSPEEYIGVIRLFFILLFTVTAFGVYWYSYRLTQKRWLSIATSSVYIFSIPTLYFSHRALSENISLPFILFGVGLWMTAQNRSEKYIGALLLGLSILFRLQNVLFFLILVSVDQFKKEKTVLRCLMIFLATLLFYGFLDRITWGGWFDSMVTYVFRNTTGSGASFYGTAPFYFYLITSLKVLKWGSLFLIPLFFLGTVQKQRTLFLLILTNFLFYSAIGHKEIRFLIPLLPLVLVLVSKGGENFKGTIPLFVTVSLLSLAQFPLLTIKDLGQEQYFPSQVSAWNRFGEINQLLFKAHDLNDICGLYIPEVPVTLTGGLSYLHRRVPFYSFTQKPRDSQDYNYIISKDKNGKYALQKTGDHCNLNRSYQWRAN